MNGNIEKGKADMPFQPNQSQLCRIQTSNSTRLGGGRVQDWGLFFRAWKYKTVVERPRHNPDKTPVQFFRREASISAVMVSGIEAALHSPFPPAPRIIS